MQREQDRVVACGEIERDEVVVVLLRARRLAREDALAVDRHGHGVAGAEEQQVPSRVLDVKHSGRVRADVEPRVDGPADVDHALVAGSEAPARTAGRRAGDLVEAWRDVLLVEGVRLVERSGDEPRSDVPIHRQGEVPFGRGALGVGRARLTGDSEDDAHDEHPRHTPTPVLHPPLCPVVDDLIVTARERPVK